MSHAVHLEGITKRFPGGVIANEDVDLTVESGSVHALLGENGAGKTTLMNVLYGLYQPTAGKVYLDGERVAFDTPKDAIDRGVGMIHQHFMLIDPMTVRDNISLGWEPRRLFGLRVDDQRVERDIRELSERYGLGIADVVRSRVENLSVGVQQRVEIMKTLYRGADVFILDEPTAVLTPQEVEELFGVLAELTAQGKTIIFITHKLGEALHAADEITVLRDGRNVGTVDADDTTKEELANLMVGRDVLLQTSKGSVTRGETVLSVSNLSVRDDRNIRQVEGLSFEVAAGEIFGIAGVDGNGQSELVEALTGLQEPTEGRILYKDADITDLDRDSRLARGMAYIPEDRQGQALVMDFDLVKNGVLGSQHREPFTVDGRIDWDAVRSHVEEIIETYDVRPTDPTVKARSLSGGNQQKFIVGREFSRDPDLVVASHPTRGVDVGSIEFIHEQLLGMRERGKAVFLVSAQLDEVTQLADRLAVMYKGQFVDVVDPDSVTEEQLGLLMAGERPRGDYGSLLGRGIA